MSESEENLAAPANDDVDAPDPPKLAEAKVRYAGYLKRNPHSAIIHYAGDDSDRLFVHMPWGDKSVAIAVPDEDAALVEALNALYLPPRYTAIYHADICALEVIWTAYKLDEHQKDLDGRKFTLNLPNASHECEFTNSSPRLLELARYVVPLEISPTGFRNLQSFNSYLNRTPEEAGDADFDAYGKPLSFWIKGVDWDDDAVISLVRHINFFLRYYDAKSPVIEVHPSGDSNAAPKNRYFEGFEFPENVHCPELDPKLMIMYSSGFSASWSMNFLSHYRVIEYGSFDFTHEVARQEVRSIISRPHALHDVERTATDLMLVLREIKTEREQEAIPKFGNYILE